MKISSNRFSDIFLQDEPINLLKRSFCNGRISQTYLFTGQKSVGKLNAAIAFSSLLQCTGITDNSDISSVSACGECDACKRILANSHPDVEIIEPIGNEIKIDQVRKLQEVAILKPTLGNWRVFIISPADRLNISSSNGLLKILEEAPEYVVFILLARETKSVLPTILSRSEVVAFRNPSYDQIRNLLASKQGLSAKKAADCVSFAGGRFVRALELAQQEDIPEEPFGMRESQTRFFIELEKFSDFIGDRFTKLNSLEEVLEFVGRLPDLSYLPLEIARAALCRSFCMHAGVPNAFPVMFTSLFLDALAKTQKKMKRPFDDLVKEAKASYSSGMINEVTSQFNHASKKWGNDQLESFFTGLSLWYEDAFRWSCSKDETLLLNLNRKEDIITIAKVDNLEVLRDRILMLNDSVGLLKRHIQPSLILENVLTQIGGLIA
jgi:DNA polymerase III delta' subunit